MTPADFTGPSVRYSVEGPVWDSVDDSVRNSMGVFAWSSVSGSVWDSVRRSVERSVWDPVLNASLSQLREPL
jgi:hypothetical protein